MKQAHDSGLLEFLRDLGTAGTAGELGRPGACPDGPFFQLSGFLLAYVILICRGGEDDGPDVLERLFRPALSALFPLLAAIGTGPLCSPFTAKHSTTAEVAGGVLSSLTLTQAWFPAFALWAAMSPAWALSAFTAFYAIFPAFSRWTTGLGQRGLMGLVIALTLLLRVPAVNSTPSEPRGRWLDRDLDHARRALADGLARWPPSWLPQSLAGVALGRMFGMRVDRGKIEPGRRAGLWPSAGDALGLGILCSSAFARFPTCRCDTDGSLHSAVGDQRPRPRPRAARTFSVVAGIRQTLGGELLALRAGKCRPATGFAWPRCRPRPEQPCTSSR